MDVTKAPPSADITSPGLGTATSAAAAPQSNAAAGISADPSTSVAVTAVADRVDIQPLDVAAALQILVAEVRAELPALAQESLPEAPELALPPTSLPGIQTGLEFDPLEPSLTPPGVRVAMPSASMPLSSPAQASPVLMRMFLQAVPQGAINPAAWSAAANRLEATLQSALDRAVATVEQWHDVPQAVVDAARETRGLVMAQLSEDPPGPLWLRPEWMWLSPQMERFRRRRRLVRSALIDPDLWPLREDDGRRDEPEEGKDGAAKPKEEH
jgi:hypothetical protein